MASLSWFPTLVAILPINSKIITKICLFHISHLSSSSEDVVWSFESFIHATVPWGGQEQKKMDRDSLVYMAKLAEQAER